MNPDVARPLLDAVRRPEGRGDGPDGPRHHGMWDSAFHPPGLSVEDRLP